MSARLTLRRLLPAEVEAVRWNASWCLSNCVRSDMPTVGAFDPDGKLLGYAVVYDHDSAWFLPPGYSTVSPLDVHPEARRQGVGTFLVDWLKEHYKVVLAERLLHSAEPFWLKGEGFQATERDIDGYCDGLWTVPGYEQVGKAFAKAYNEM